MDDYSVFQKLGFEYMGAKFIDGETVTSYQKTVENEYTIRYDTYENEWGGKSLITVVPLPIWGETVDVVYHMRPPVLEFFATGLQEFKELHNKIVEEIVPTLKKWAIKVI